MRHRFKWQGYNNTALLEGVNTLGEFMKRLDTQSQEDHNKGWTPHEYAGMGFEALVEVLINASSVDKRFNIVEYRPHSTRVDGKDVGIDGFGKSHNGNYHTVQIKLRNDPTWILNTKDAISNFVAKTTSSPVYKDADMSIFTTAQGVNQFLNEQMYHNRIRVHGIKEMKDYLDNNKAFWDRFRKEMGVK
jgi:hypothetical protein